MTDSPIDEVIESIEGTKLPAFADPELARICDTCGTRIDGGDRVGLYFVNPTFRNEDLSGLAFFRLHCPGCSELGLYASATGYLELFVRASYGDNEVVTDAELSEVSPPSDGIPYDPVEVIRELMVDDVDVESEFIERDELAGPQDAVYHLHTLGLDILELVDEESGEITVTDEDRELFLQETVKMVTGDADEEVLKHAEDKYGK